MRPGRIAIQLGLPVKNEPLAGLECFLEIMPVKKFAGQRARLVANEQVIHAAARSRVPDEAAAQRPAREWCRPARERSREFWRSGCGLRSGRANSREDLQTSAARAWREFPRGAVLRLSGTSARSWASRTFLVYIIAPVAQASVCAGPLVAQAVAASQDPTETHRLKSVLLSRATERYRMPCNRLRHGKRWIVCACATGGVLAAGTARPE